MARCARIIAPGSPHHVTQRGNFGMTVFSSDDDFQFYKLAFHEYLQDCNVSVLAYALMDNHVHFALVPSTEKELSRLFQATNTKFTKHIKSKHQSSGHLWQSRFFAKPIFSSKYLREAVRYIENNPVKAKLVRNAVDYRWSSARSRICGSEDLLLSPLAGWGQYLPEQKYWQEWLSRDPKLAE